MENVTKKVNMDAAFSMEAMAAAAAAVAAAAVMPTLAAVPPERSPMSRSGNAVSETINRTKSRSKSNERTYLDFF